jgi:peptidoglycan/LPS O-acetylase OafA/YrhL
MRIAYSPSLDGLRCVAVLVVIAYHFGLKSFSGGFVGVDVFFVLSGFLITTVVAGEWDAGKFTFAGFWFRRIRRLMPAYFAMASVTAVVGYFLLLPADFLAFGRSLMYQSVFASNFLFRSEAGYFDAPAQLKPLLHTWSLAVEEQFYMIFPVLLVAFLRFGRKRFAGLLAILALASFAACVALQGSTDAFFLPQTRIWEILVGCILAVTVAREKAAQLPSLFRETAALLAAAAIALPVFAFNDTTLFPGWATLAPVGGAAALIALGTGRPTSIHRVLALPAMAAIGRLSYSLYLWHWPVTVFTRYVGAPESVATYCAMALATVLLSTVSYFVVEVPCRRWISEKFPTGFAVSVVAFSVLLAALGSVIVRQQGMRARFSAHALLYADAEKDRMHWWEPAFSQSEFAPADKTQTGLRSIGAPDAQTRILFWGNSHMGHLLPAAQRLAVKHRAKVYFPSQNCAWFSVDKPSKDCGAVTAHVRQLLHEKYFSKVVWADFWQRLAEQADFENRLWESAALFAESGTPVTVVGPVPTYSFEVPIHLALSEQFGFRPMVQTLQQHQATTRFIQTQLGKLPSAFRSIDLSTALCPNNGNCLMAHDGRSLYSDSNHLSVTGTQQIEKALETAF